MLRKHKGTQIPAVSSGECDLLRLPDTASSSTTSMSCRPAVESNWAVTKMRILGLSSYNDIRCHIALGLNATCFGAEVPSSLNQTKLSKFKNWQRHFADDAREGAGQARGLTDCARAARLWAVRAHCSTDLAVQAHAGYSSTCKCFPA